MYPIEVKYIVLHIVYFTVQNYQCTFLVVIPFFYMKSLPINKKTTPLSNYYKHNDYYKLISNSLFHFAN